MAAYIDSITLSKLRGINILVVADALGIGLRHRNALCVSHDESNPSLRFRPSTNTCFCFACAGGGDDMERVGRGGKVWGGGGGEWLGGDVGIVVGSGRQPARGTVGQQKTECDTDR